MNKTGNAFSGKKNKKERGEDPGGQTRPELRGRWDEGEESQGPAVRQWQRPGGERREGGREEGRNPGV